MKWYKISGLIYTDQPFIKKTSAGGHQICLIGYEGKIFATSAKCPHANEDITQGWCSEGKLVCPYHRFSYNLETGRGSPGQNDYINVYNVKIENEDVYIGFETFKEKLKKMFE